MFQTRNGSSLTQITCSSGTQSVLDVGRQAEGNVFWNSQLSSLLEANVVVDVDNFPAAQLHQDVVQVTIAQSNDVADD